MPMYTVPSMPTTGEEPKDPSVGTDHTRIPLVGSKQYMLPSVEPMYTEPSVPSAGDPNTFAPVSNSHRMLLFIASMPYTVEPAPTAIKPAALRAGEDVTGPDRSTVNRMMTAGPEGPECTERLECCALNPNWPHGCTKGEGEGVIEGVGENVGVIEMVGDTVGVTLGDALGEASANSEPAAIYSVSLRPMTGPAVRAAAVE